MATKKAAAADAATQDQAEQAEARALVDIPDLGASAGTLVVAAADVIAGLVAGGQADDHPEAVAYAKSLQA